MRWEKRKDRKGQEYYSFMYYCPTTKTNVRLKKEDTVFIKSDAEADDFARRKTTELDATVIRIERKLEWQKKYYDFEQELLPLYEVDRREKAPNSYENHLYYLRQYVFPFYLNIKDCNNLNLWSEFHEEFIDHLRVVKTVKGSRPLAWNTRNHCIIALNTFLECMLRKKKMHKDFFSKCKLFENHLMRKLTIDDIYLPEELDRIAEYLRTYTVEKDGVTRLEKKYYEFFVCLRDTGCRINEARGLSLGDIHRGEISEPNINRALNTYGITYQAYIYLSSQPLNHRKSTCARDKDGNIQRKDLKGKNKKTPDRKARFIPIESMDLYEIFKSRRMKQIDLLSKLTHGENKMNYLLFDDINIDSFERVLAKVCNSLGIRYRSPHAFRHARATHLAGLTLGNTFVLSLILGHERETTTQNYLHLHGALKRTVANMNEEDTAGW